MIRDSLAKLAPADADEPAQPPRRHPQATRRPVDLGGGRRRPQRFGGLPDPRTHPEPPLT